MGVFEVIRIDNTVRALINAGADETQIADHAFASAANLGAAARELVLAGETTPEEAFRISRMQDA
jgi:general secretion pathway protein E